ncbi:hypothetical protein IU448_19360 [Nocardia flavorosea]|uniref:hypothetical protein n=1 Tax=Nocardia flavorosea TaxID=53429 RepID=UPI001895464F|nr:hypothetical protein [Nocardia flavorosea]MBF6351155.1 hypothetical protein [Nocardia flavorosea]
MDNVWFDEAAQQGSDWQLFARPARIAEQVDRLFTETLPTVPTGPGGWKTYAGDPVPAMPQVDDRYSDDLTLHWLAQVFDFFFPDEDTLFDKADIADQWVCYIGAYFVERCGGRWANVPSVGGTLYEYGPSVVYDWLSSTADFPVDLLCTAVEEQDFSVVTDKWYQRDADYAEAHGLPHEANDLRRTLG